MSENTKIEWADHTFNPWEGCQKVGPGCDHCYAESRNARFAGGTAINWGPGAPRRRTSQANWLLPLRWNAQHEAFFAKQGRRQRVFCASLADVFDNAVPADWRRDLFDLILSTPHLDWLLLTKRIGNAARMIEETLPPESPLAWPWPHVWIGATVVNQSEADRDYEKLMAVPAARRFLSIEPMLGPISLRWLSAWPESAPTTAQNPSGTTDHLDGLRRLDWVIVGGESGPDARPMHPDWARQIRDQCKAAGVPFLFKQWGEWAPRSSCYHTFEDGKSLDEIDPGATRWPCIRMTYRGSNGHDLAHAGDDGDEAYMQRTGKKAAGRLLDGVEWNGAPS